MRRLFWIMLATFLASSAAAQSLAEIAKKEKDRRANNNEEQTRTITESDLRRNLRGPMTTSTAVSATDEVSEDEGDAEPETEPEDPRQTAEYWRNRLSSVDQRIQTLQEQLQSPLNTSDPRGGATETAPRAAARSGASGARRHRRRSAPRRRPARLAAPSFSCQFELR